MNNFRMTLLGTLTVSGLILANSASAASGSTASIPYSTPVGVTLVNVTKLMDHSIPQFLWRRLGDASGKPLYTYDADTSGKSNCYDECAVEFAPFVPEADGIANGDFTIISRKDGVKQWVYQGKPLYRYAAGKDPVGEPVGQRFQLKEDPAWADPASNVYSPKQGWRRASFTPENTFAMPPGVEVAASAIANGFIFVHASTKMTIYAVPSAVKLSKDWEPFRASALAMPVGDFTIAKRDDGTRQWVFKGEPLYTFAEDYAPGEVSGTIAEKQAHAAMAYQNFMPQEVAVGQYLRGPLLTNAEGKTLYTQARYKLLYGGTESRGTYGISYNDAKSQGVIACDAACNETWKPLLAPDNARPQGYWEVYNRADGQKQWSFKGSPLYTYVGDTHPGDNYGNNRHVIVYGGAQGQIVYANPGNDLKSPEAKLGDVKMAEVDPNKPGMRRFGGNRPNEDGQGAAGAQAGAPAAAAQGAGGGQANADAGGDQYAPGYYWHTAGVFY